MIDTVHAPWTQEQVDNLKTYQASGVFHPYTCANRGNGSHVNRLGDLGQLVPTVNGWICMDCDYTQDWAASFSLEPLPNIECGTCGSVYLAQLEALACCS